MDIDPVTQTDIRRAVSLYSAGRFTEALAAIKRVLQSHPANVDALNFAAACSLRLGRNVDAEAYWRRVIKMKPEYADAHYNLGLLLQKLQRLHEAGAAYQRAIAIRPDNVQAHCNLGVVLVELKRVAEAESVYRRAITIRPDYAEVHSNLGNLLRSLKRFSEAEAAYRRALTIRPNNPDAYNHLGLLLQELKRFSEAEAAYRRALAVQPGCPDANWYLSLLLLHLGRWSEGWSLYEARYRGDTSRGTIAPSLSYPQWQGEALQGKSLLIWPEQGFGDEIQFVRYLPLLKAQGATRITLVCKPELRPLFQSMAGTAAVITPEEVRNTAAHDFWTFLLSIPLHLGTTPESVPNQLPYLQAPQDRIETWRPRLPEAGLRVGLVWKGRASHKNDSNRSLPGLASLAPLWTVPGLSFVSLQKGQGEAEAIRPPVNQPIRHLGSDIRDFADSAAIIVQLDLVISVDTAIAHLAGALGKPCWVLLPSLGTDWRWMDARVDSPWYPGVMRLFRQEGLGWSEIVSNVAKALLNWGD
ncbi:tetratricopeptide repeat protein [Paraburkholderia phenazinium]|uniref:tetratricopeptide repeat-containing glycosyltransferase family protein n=1 Tax=Paraburkholderia phenazinium TaxID=60549 RepID=UPI00158C4016|nr:tetratricopeptide repeat-containing glycosyltransferase family protein [Paraburkholderia phenazinium]